MKKDVKQFIKHHKKEILIGGGALIITVLGVKRLIWVVNDMRNFYNILDKHNEVVVYNNEDMMNTVPQLEWVKTKCGKTVHIEKLIAIGDIVK